MSIHSRGPLLPKACGLVLAVAGMLAAGCATTATTQADRNARTSAAIAKGSTTRTHGSQTIRMTAVVGEFDGVGKQSGLRIVMETTAPAWPDELIPILVLFRPKSADMNFNGFMLQPDGETVKIIGDLIAGSEFAFPCKGNRMELFLPLVELHSGPYELQVFLGDGRGTKLAFSDPRVDRR